MEGGRREGGVRRRRGKRGGRGRRRRTREGKGRGEKGRRRDKLIEKGKEKGWEEYTFSSSTVTYASSLSACIYLTLILLHPFLTLQSLLDLFPSNRRHFPLWDNRSSSLNTTTHL